jgi:hypothetical protein
MTFDRAGLHAQVTALKEKVGRLRKSSLNEENTKMSLITPMIQALGWDVANPDEVHCEYRRKSKALPVDYALMIDRTPCLLIEAKAMGESIEDDRWISQVLNYTNQSGVQWAVLTNGVEYRIYNSSAIVPTDEKLFRHVALLDAPVPKIVDDLSLLSRPELERRRIDRAWEIHNTDRLVRDGILRLLDRESPSTKIVQMLVRGSKGRLARKGVLASLRRANIAIEIPSGPKFDDGPGRRRRDSIPDGTTSPTGSPVVAGRRRRTASVNPLSLQDLLRSGAIRAPVELFAQTRHGRASATIESDGSVVYARTRYDSVSAAGAAARAALQPGKWRTRGGPRTNGWIFWKLRHPGSGKIVAIKAMVRP